MTKFIELLLAIIPIAIKIWETVEANSKKARNTVAEVQEKKAERVKNVLEGNVDELSKADYIRNKVLFELLRKRRVRKTANPTN